jgi:hypothetical protein
VSWLWTEIAEYITRDTFREEVIGFMNSDNQFTREDGDRLVAIMSAMNRRMDLDEVRVERLADEAHTHEVD